MEKKLGKYVTLIHRNELLGVKSVTREERNLICTGKNISRKSHRPFYK